MSVLFVSYSGLLGGSERVLADVASHLERECILACPEGPLADHARVAGVRVLPIRGRRLEVRAPPHDRLAAIPRLAGLGREVREICAALQPAVVFGWGARAAIASLAALRGLRPRPKLVFQHNDLLPAPWVLRAARAAARSADRVVAPSEVIAGQLDPSGALGPRLARIRQGVDLSRFEPAGPAPGPPHALVLGALVDWKRPELALEAAALAATELPDLRLTIAGPVISPGDETAASLARRAALPDLDGRVTLAGNVADVTTALRSASCLLHCADCEPYGLVLVEAMASALPVVAPDACGPAEILGPSCGRLYPPGDAQAAARALVEVLGDPDTARALGALGRGRAEQLFDVRRTRQHYRELVAELAPEPAGAAHVQRDGQGIALVTVTHDSKRDLSRLLESVGRHLPAARVVVVDSGSHDSGPEAARAWNGGATVVELGENAGFGRACNVGIEKVDEPVTVLVNPDVELLDSSLADLARELERPGAPERLLAPAVLLPDGTRQDSAQREPGSPALVVMAGLPPAALPGAASRAIEPWRAERPRRAGWAVGCCVVARTDTLRRLGPFDERLFLYAEDLDLGLRAADVGIATWFWPEARVLHRGAHSTAAVFGGEPYELLARRRREVIGERRGPRRAKLDDLVQGATFVNRIVLKTLLGRPSARERCQLRALLKARRTPPWLGA